MDYRDITPEQRAKVEACTSPEELIALAQEEGIELSDEQLEKVAGGSWGSNPGCPECGSSNVAWDDHLGLFICNSCGYEFT